jgi:hypothetical protein
LQGGALIACVNRVVQKSSTSLDFLLLLDSSAKWSGTSLYEIFLPNSNGKCTHAPTKVLPFQPKIGKNTLFHEWLIEHLDSKLL